MNNFFINEDYEQNESETFSYLKEQSRKISKDFHTISQYTNKKEKQKEKSYQKYYNSKTPINNYVWSHNNNTSDFQSTSYEKTRRQEPEHIHERIRVKSSKDVYNRTDYFNLRTSENNYFQSYNNNNYNNFNFSSSSYNEPQREIPKLIINHRIPRDNYLQSNNNNNNNNYNYPSTSYNEPQREIPKLIINPRISRENYLQSNNNNNNNFDFSSTSYKEPQIKNPELIDAMFFSPIQRYNTNEYIENFNRMKQSKTQFLNSRSSKDYNNNSSSSSYFYEEPQREKSEHFHETIRVKSSKNIFNRIKISNTQFFNSKTSR